MCLSTTIQCIQQQQNDLPETTIILFLFFFHADNLSGVAACDLDQATSGCRIDNGACQCGYGCKSEYRYPDRATCTTALKVTLPLSDF